MSDLNKICEFLGTKRADEIKDYMVSLIEDDIYEAVKESYTWIIEPEILNEFGKEIFNEVKDELKKKYKKQLKGVMEEEILKIINRGDKDEL